MIIESAVFWAALGAALLVIEVLTFGMVLVFFGVAALVVAVLTAGGVIEELPAQLAWFSILSVLSLMSLRRVLSRWFKGVTRRATGPEDDTSLLNRRATVASRFENGAGTVTLGGTKWDAVSAVPLEVGQVVRVTGRQGIAIEVAPIEDSSAPSAKTPS